MDVNQKWSRTHPYLFIKTTPMEFFTSIAERHNKISQLTHEEFSQLEKDIETLKTLNISYDLNNIVDHNRSLSSPMRS